MNLNEYDADSDPTVTGPFAGGRPPAPPRKRRLPPWLVVGGLVLLTAVGAAVWLLLSRGHDPWRYAPGHVPVVGMWHVEMPEAWAAIRPTMAAQESVRDILPDIDAFVARCRWVDVYLLQDPSNPKVPCTVCAMKTDLTVDDIRGMIARAGLPADTLRPAGPGRYEVPAGPQRMAFVFGGQGNGVAAGMVLAGPARILTVEALGRLGRGDYSRLRRLIGQVDTDAPVFGVVDLRAVSLPMFAVRNSDIDELAASGTLSPTVRWRYHLVYQDAKRARAVFGDYETDRKRPHFTMTARRDEAAVDLDVELTPEGVRKVLADSAAKTAAAMDSPEGPSLWAMLMSELDWPNLEARAKLNFYRARVRGATRGPATMPRRP